MNELRPAVALPDGFLEDLARADALGTGVAKSALADAQRTMRRAIRRADAAPPFEAVDIICTHSASVSFNGRMIGEWSNERNGNADWHAGEVWETKGGALIAVHYWTDQGDELAEAMVVPPADIEAERHAAIMAFFRWHFRARRMVKDMGWSMMLEID